jgi:protein involved in polysaccharide export with SLBB domain
VVAGVGLAIGLAAGLGPRADAQPPQPSQPDDLKVQRERVDRDLEAAKARLKGLEAQKAALDERARQAAAEPHIGVWVRPPRIPLASALGSTAGTYDATGLGLRLDAAYQATAGSEFAINEFTGPGKPVVEAHFYDVRSLQVYLTRAAKDPTAPKKLRLHVDKDYPWDKAKAVIDACKAAGFGPIELAAAGAPGVWGHLPERVRGTPAPATPARPPYVIDPPDVLFVEAVVRDGDKTESLPVEKISGPFQVRADGTVGLGAWGSVNVSGLTVEQTREAVRKHLLANDLLKEKSARPESLIVAVDVRAFNSKKYLVVYDGPEGGAGYTCAFTGRDTVLDALAAAGLSARLGEAEVTLARRHDGAADGRPQVSLPVDWAAIRRGDEATNYPLLPGDCVYVKPKK